MPFASFDDRLASRLDQLSPAEQRVAEHFKDHKEEVLHASAASLAERVGVSDATVVRTAKTLGFKGMDDLRFSLAADLKQNLSLNTRLTETLRHVGDDFEAALSLTLDIHLGSISGLRRDITPDRFRTAIKLIGDAGRVVVFGIGPSGAMADYFAMQLGRFGLDARSLTRTGLLFADDVRQLRQSDVLVIMGYTRVYRELRVLLEEAPKQKIPIILVTDSLGSKLGARVNLVLPVARGRAAQLSMHTATLVLLEALLVGIAAKAPKATAKSLKALHRLREEIVGEPMDIAIKSHKKA